MVAGNCIIALAFIFIVLEDIFWQWLGEPIPFFFFSNNGFLKSNVKYWLEWGVDRGTKLSRTALIVYLHPDVRQACSSRPGLLQSRVSEYLFPKCTSKSDRSVRLFLLSLHELGTLWLIYCSANLFPLLTSFIHMKRNWILNSFSRNNIHKLMFSLGCQLTHSKIVLTIQVMD